MSKYTGVISMGVKAPIIRQGDDIKTIVINSVENAVKNSGMKFTNKDIIGITESVVARSQGNYVTIDDIVQFLTEKKFGKNLVLVDPIMSRNRFSMILKAFARYANNIMFDITSELDQQGNPTFKPNPFTGVDILEYYKDICAQENCNVFVNDYANKGKLSWTYIDCRCHPDENNVIPLTLGEIMSTPVTREDGTSSGYNLHWGLLGSNKANEDTLKLFPRKLEAQQLVEDIQKEFQERYGVTVEVMVYGDGCFHSPEISGVFGSSINEFADPVTTPASTSGLEGTPNELKIKNFADEKYKHLNGKALERAIKEEIKNSQKDLVGSMVSQGTTPRRYTDLLASLMDLCTGSGSKGTPIVYIHNYFNNYSND